MPAHPKWPSGLLVQTLAGTADKTRLPENITSPSQVIISDSQVWKLEQCEFKSIKDGNCLLVHEIVTLQGGAGRFLGHL